MSATSRFNNRDTSLANWYYKLNDTIHGPVTSHDMHQLIRSGEVTKTTLVATAEDGKAPSHWVQAERIRGAEFLVDATAQPDKPTSPPPRSSQETQPTNTPNQSAPTQQQPNQSQPTQRQPTNAPPIHAALARSERQRPVGWIAPHGRWKRSDLEFASTLPAGEQLLSVHRRSIWTLPLFGPLAGAFTMFVVFATVILAVIASVVINDNRPSTTMETTYYITVSIWLGVLACFFSLLALIGTLFMIAQRGVLRITNQRVLYERGIFARTTKQISLAEVKTVSSRMSFLQRAFECGRIVALPKSDDRKRFQVAGLSRPWLIAEEIRAQMGAAR